VGYLRRVWAMAVVTIGFNIHSLLTTRYMLKVDGFKGWQRFKLMAKGMWWIFKPGGLYMPILGHYLQYYKPGFHPWQSGQMRSYHLWLDTFNRTGDPILAGEVLHAAGA
jgi:predicted metal-dependent hydrolase